MDAQNLRQFGVIDQAVENLLRQADGIISLESDFVERMKHWNQVLKDTQFEESDPRLSTWPTDIQKIWGSRLRVKYSGIPFDLDAEMESIKFDETKLDEIFAGAVRFKNKEQLSQDVWQTIGPFLTYELYLNDLFRNKVLELAAEDKKRLMDSIPSEQIN